MKSIDDYKTEEILKVMLQVAKNRRELNNVEKKIDLIIGEVSEVSNDRTREIINILVSNGWILTRPRLQKRTQYFAKIYQYLYSKGEGLSPEGENELNRRIEKYNDELNRQIEKKCKERKTNRRKTLMGIIKWIGGIISGLVIAYFIWFFGWNGNRQAKHPDDIPNIQEQIKTDYDHIQSQITEI